jgi:hypothetical protein
MTDKTYEVMWHKEYRGYYKTEIEAPGKPKPAEAAQVVAVKEDEDASRITVDAVRAV